MLRRGGKDRKRASPARKLRLLTQQAHGDGMRQLLAQVLEVLQAVPDFRLGVVPDGACVEEEHIRLRKEATEDKIFATHAIHRSREREREHLPTSRYTSVFS